MIKSKIKIKKIIQLELQTIFYLVAIYFLLIFFNVVSFDFSSFKDLFFPVIIGQYWFYAAYFGLYLLIPFINKLAHVLKKREYEVMLIILTLLISVVRTIYPINDTFEGNRGYGLVWFVYLYLLGGYIRLHYNKINSKLKMSIIFIAIIAIEVLLHFECQVFDKSLLSRIFFKYEYAYSSFLLLIQSLMMFLIFKDIHIKNKIVNKIILYIAPLTFGVYLIHEQIYLRKILWVNIFKPSEISGTLNILFSLIITIIFVFIVGCIIEKIRSEIFKIISKTKVIRKMSDKIDKIKIFEDEEDEINIKKN